ncbi:MAG TPA: hypothetical protein VH877_22060 [Polyangia bacterium]|jgi:hypothetical protein|nr:hypothetical protein [Polyangia bacterium]
MSTSTHDQTEDLVEVYRTIGLLEADRAMVEILQPAGIPCFRRDRISHALPAPDAQPGAYFIAVSAGNAEQARKLLAQAISDRALDPAEGEIIRPS